MNLLNIQIYRQNAIAVAADGNAEHRRANDHQFKPSLLLAGVVAL